MLTLLGALMLPAPWAAAGPSLALSGSEPGAAPGSAIVQPVARKGTRNYVPEATPETDTTAPADPAAEAQALKDCIAIWDAKTHITKSKWREICQRQIKERAQLSEH